MLKKTNIAQINANARSVQLLHIINSICGTVILPHRRQHLQVLHSALQRTRNVDMEERPVKTLHDRNARRVDILPICRTLLDRLLKAIAIAAGALARLDLTLLLAQTAPMTMTVTVLDVLGSLAFKLAAIGFRFRERSGRGLATNVRDGEDGLPAVEGSVGAFRARVAEAGRHEGALGPAVVDGCEVPLYCVRGSPAVELVADVDEMLRGGDIDIVDGGEVEDDSFEGWLVRVGCSNFAFAWARIVPWPIAGSSVRIRVRAARLLEDLCDHVVEVVIGVRVIIALGESVDKDAWVRMVDIEVRVGAIFVRDRDKHIADRLVWVIIGPALAHCRVSRLNDMIANDRVHLHATEEATLRLEDAEDKKRERGSHGDVDADFDAGEDGDNDTSEEDDHFQRRDPPELVDSVGRSDQVSNSVNDNS